MKITAVYDVCEDAVAEVRVKLVPCASLNGTSHVKVQLSSSEIVKISFADAKLLHKKADVLRQLSRSGAWTKDSLRIYLTALHADKGSDIVKVLQQALTAHIEHAPSTSLQSLYDQLSLNGVSEHIRAQLAILVSSSMSDVTPRPVNMLEETQTADAYIELLPKLQDNDFISVIRTQCLPHAAFPQQSRQANLLLRVVVQRLEACLVTDLKPSHPSPLSSKACFDLAFDLIMQKQVILPYMELLRRRVVPWLRMSDAEERKSVVIQVTEVMDAAAGSSPNSEEDKEKLEEDLHCLLGETPLLIDVLTKCSNEPASVRAYEHLLSALVTKRHAGWNPPPNVSQAVQTFDILASPSIRELTRIFLGDTFSSSQPGSRVISSPTKPPPDCQGLPTPDSGTASPPPAVSAARQPGLHTLPAKPLGTTTTLSYSLTSTLPPKPLVSPLKRPSSETNAEPLKRARHSPQDNTRLRKPSSTTDNTIPTEGYKPSTDAENSTIALLKRMQAPLQRIQAMPPTEPRAHRNNLLRKAGGGTPLGQRNDEDASGRARNDEQSHKSGRGSEENNANGIRNGESILHGTAAGVNGDWTDNTTNEQRDALSLSIRGAAKSSPTAKSSRHSHSHSRSPSVQQRNRTASAQSLMDRIL